jgi:transcriptional regulator with XRE-family HTH domain/tetratricopeptide (TPR) repeat protein
MEQTATTRGIAARVRRLRDQYGWSARELAVECARAGSTTLTRGTIAKIESGVRKSVSSEEIATLARVLGVSARELLGAGQDGLSPFPADVSTADQPLGRHRTILLADIESYADPRRASSDQIEVRATLHRALRSAFLAAGIPWDTCYVEDRGDGLLVVAPPGVAKVAFVDSLPRALVEALTEHNDRHPPAQQVRLRVAVHAGTVQSDAYGITSAAANVAFRLVDAPQLKVALGDSPGALGLIVSDWFFEEVVRLSPAVDSAAYRMITMAVKETQLRAWICLPGHVVPSHAVGAERRQSAVVPRQLPAAPRGFAGRDQSMAALDDALRAAQVGGTVPISVITGMGGIGKTWLGLAWAHKVADQFPDGQLYANLRGFTPEGAPAAPTEVLRGFLETLGVPSNSIPTSPEAQAALYRSLIAGRRMLVILDNARDTDQVAQLLPGTSPNAVVVTARHRLTGMITEHGASSIQLSVLDDDACRQLLAARLGQERLVAEPAAVAALLRQCAGMPLALSIAASHLAAHPELSMADLVADLTDTTSRLDELGSGEPGADVRSVIAVSYQALTAAAAGVFRLLGVAPGPDIEVSAVSVLSGLSRGQVITLLRELENAYLVQRHSRTRYRMHDLIRLYAAEMSEMDDLDRREAALRRLISYYVAVSVAADRILEPHRPAIAVSASETDRSAPGFGDEAAGIDWFDTELACLLAAQEVAGRHGWYEFVWQLAWSMHSYLSRRGRLADHMRVSQLGLGAARQLGDAASECVAAAMAGGVNARAGATVEADAQWTRSLDLANELGDVANETRAHIGLSQVHREGDFERASGHVSEAVRLSKSLGDRVLQAEASVEKGWQMLRLEQLAEAREAGERALDLFRQVGYQTGQAFALEQLGSIDDRAKDHQRALIELRSSVELWSALGASVQEADTLIRMGSVLAETGRRDAARSAWQRAVDLKHDAGQAIDAERVGRQLRGLEENAG